jgi:hypothetical protein
MAKASWAIELETLDVMLQDRGYSQSKQHQHGDEPVLIRTCRDSRGELTLVFLSSEIKVGVRTLRKMRAEAQASGSRHVLLLSQEGLTPFAVRELAEQQDMDIEIFTGRLKPASAGRARRLSSARPSCAMSSCRPMSR